MTTETRAGNFPRLYGQEVGTTSDVFSSAATFWRAQARWLTVRSLTIPGGVAAENVPLAFVFENPQ